MFIPTCHTLLPINTVYSVTGHQLVYLSNNRQASHSSGPGTGGYCMQSTRHLDGRYRLGSTEGPRGNSNKVLMCEEASVLTTVHFRYYLLHKFCTLSRKMQDGLRSPWVHFNNREMIHIASAVLFVYHWSTFLFVQFNYGFGSMIIKRKSVMSVM